MTDDLLSLEDAVVVAFHGACDRVLRGQGSGGALDPRPVLWLYVDHVLLLAQAPIYITVSLLDRERQIVLRRFSSLSPQDRAFWNLAPLEFEAPDPDDVRIDRPDEGKALIVTLRSTPGTVLPAIERRATARGARRLLESNNIGDLVFQALEQLPSDHPNGSTVSPTRVIADHEWEAQLALIRAHLDPILNSYGSCGPFPRDRDGRTRLFVAPRQPFTEALWGRGYAARTVKRSGQERPAAYGYTAGVFLTPTQAADRGIPDDDLRFLAPLPNGARAIADTPLTTGLIDIGRPGERTPSNPLSREYYPREAHMRALALENEIYGPAQQSESIFYIPVHIGGVPWLALFAFHDETDNRREVMWQRYNIYTHIVPVMAEQMAQAVAQAFTDALAEAARGHLGTLADPQLFAERCTKAWSDLGVVFPYGTPRLSSVDENQGVMLCIGVRGSLKRLYLTVARPESNVSYRLLDLELTCRLLALRLQAAVETRTQERHTLLGLTVHEWVNKLADGIARSERLKEAAIAADLDDALMDHVYGLYGTLHGDIGLPWILDESRSSGDSSPRYFARRPPSGEDVHFLRVLFEFHVRAMLGAWDRPGPAVGFRFNCDEFPMQKCDLRLLPGDPGLAEVGRELEQLLVQCPSPWPLDSAAAHSLTTREGVLSALTLAPREMLRNAIRHGTSHSAEDLVTFEVRVQGHCSGISALVANGVPPGTDVEKRLTDMRERCIQLQNAVPFANCYARHDVRRNRLVVECTLTVDRGEHE